MAAIETKCEWKTGEVIVVMNKNYWEAGPGQMLRSILAVDFLICRNESRFQFIQHTGKCVFFPFQVHRNIIICNINPKLEETKIVIQKDIWAAPQIVITVSGPSEEAVTEKLEAKRFIEKCP